MTTTIQTIARITLGIILLTTGTGHLTFLRSEFQAQVPTWVPLNVDLVVVLSGIVELILGLSPFFVKKYRTQVGWATAVFFILIFPGNIAQLTEHRDEFGLNSDLLRWARLPFQLVLIYVSLWSTGAWNPRGKSRQ